MLQYYDDLKFITNKLLPEYENLNKIECMYIEGGQLKFTSQIMEKWMTQNKRQTRTLAFQKKTQQKL